MTAPGGLFSGLVGARVAQAIDDSPVPLAGTITAVEPYDLAEGPVIVLVKWDGDADGPCREPFDDLRQVGRDPALQRAAVRMDCERCGALDFAVMYDPAAQATHVECASCGEVRHDVAR